MKILYLKLKNSIGIWAGLSKTSIEVAVATDHLPRAALKHAIIARDKTNIIELQPTTCRVRHIINLIA